MNTHSGSMSKLNLLKTGGNQIISQSFSQRIFSFFTVRNIGFLLLIVALVLVTYYTYKQYSSNKASFSANREGTSNEQPTNNTATMMLFYVDWCPHCKTAKPEWEALKTEYENKKINGYNVIFVEHNCTNESAEVEQLMNKYSIDGYPTIKLIKDNQVIEYDAKPTKSTMEQFLNTVL